MLVATMKIRKLEMQDALLIDSHKLHFHPERVAQWLEGKDDWEKAKKLYPIYLEISPVGVCNHSCSFCGIDYILEANREAGNYPKLDLEIWKDRAAEMGTLGIKSFMFAGEGEPLLHKQINEMGTAATHAHIDVAFTTNGVLLNKLDLACLSWVKVSVNAGTRETYAKVHRTKEKDWDTLWANLRDAAKRKGNCTLGVQMVCLPENAGEEKALQALCDDAGVDYLVLKPYSQHKMSITKQYEGYKPINLPAGKGTVIREEAIET